MKLVKNIPLDTEKIAQLVSNRDDLFLVWPAAKYPFDHGQWKEVLNPEKGNKSFFVYDKGNLVGHCALLATEESGKYSIAFLYLLPEYRSKGHGSKIVGHLEHYAVDKLAAKELSLVVRDYNPRAVKCYVKSGFKEDSREGTLISMSKISAGSR